MPQPIEIRWDYLAEIDRKIARRQSQPKPPTLEELFPKQSRFTISIWIPYHQQWFDHGPCRVVKWTKTHLHYLHEEYDRDSKRSWCRRMTREEVQVALVLKKVTFHRTSGRTPSTTFRGQPGAGRRG